MKITNKYVQIAIGFLPVMLLWYIGASASDSYLMNTINPITWSIENDFLSVLVVCSMPVLLFVYAFISKRYKLRAMYFSSVVAVVLPVLAYICSFELSDDGSVISFLLVISMAIIPLYPFIVLGIGTFDGVNEYIFATQHRSMNCEMMCLCFLNVILISILIFTLVKPKQVINQSTVDGGFVDVTNQQNF